MRFLIWLSDRPFRLLKWLLVTVVAGMITLAILDAILDDFSVSGLRGLLLTAITMAFLPALLWPVVYRVTRWIPALLFPVVIFVATGAIVLLAAWIDDELGISSITVENLLTGIWVAIGLTIGTTVIGTLFTLDERSSYDRFVTRPLKIRYGRSVSDTSPGFIFLEIDGLAGPVLQKAIDGGYAPTMKRWIDDGSHKLTIWEPDLSCQTSASQAGILLGSNENIPAFRWWDKQRQRMMVSSKMNTAKELEAELSSHRGLLEPDGVSRFNVFTGGASDSLGTFSALGTAGGSREYWAYFANPFTLGRTLSLFVQDVFREWWEEFQQKRQDVHPRLSRPWRYALVRSATTAVLTEMARFMIIADLFRGVSAAYYTLFAYDEVAHHTGIDRHYTFKVLRNIDRMFAHLEEVAKDAPRPMHLIVLSDHGQSQGATFLQKHGYTLGEFVKSLLPGEATVGAYLETNESVGHFNAMLTESAKGDSNAARAASYLLKGRTQDGVVDIGPAEALENTGQAEAADDVIVLASGNLGLISFTKWPERMTLQEITGAFPGLIEGLSTHPEIGLVMVTDAVDGGIVIGQSGVYSLETDSFEGSNPLVPYGELAARHLRRTNTFPACPDILVISTYHQDTGEVPAFEELVGNHGGLGGSQRHPFVLHPVEFETGDELIVGAAELNRVMRGWISGQRKLSSGSVPESSPDEFSPTSSSLPTSA